MFRKLGRKGPYFERLIMIFVEMTIDKAHEKFMKKIADEMTMYRLIRDHSRLYIYIILHVMRLV